MLQLQVQNIVYLKSLLMREVGDRIKIIVQYNLQKVWQSHLDIMLLTGWGYGIFTELSRMISIKGNVLFSQSFSGALSLCNISIRLICNLLLFFL